MIKWIELNDMDYANPIREARFGLPPVERSVPVHEIPLRLGIEFSPKPAPRVIVHFEYMKPEPVDTLLFKQGVSFDVGRHSGRIIRGDFDISPLLASGGMPRPEALGAYIVKNITEFIEHRRARRAEQRKNVARMLFRNNRSELFKSVEKEYA